nr:unnamed protein product [Callosobruchus analis]
MEQLNWSFIYDNNINVNGTHNINQITENFREFDSLLALIDGKLAPEEQRSMEELQQSTSSSLTSELALLLAMEVLADDALVEATASSTGSPEGVLLL